MDLTLCIIHAFGINPISDWQKKLLTIEDAYSFESEKVGKFLIDFAKPTESEKVDLGEITVKRAIYK